jgi:hypothetical protein
VPYVFPFVLYRFVVFFTNLFVVGVLMSSFFNAQNSRTMLEWIMDYMDYDSICSF